MPETLEGVVQKASAQPQADGASPVAPSAQNVADLSQYAPDASATVASAPTEGATQGVEGQTATVQANDEQLRQMQSQKDKWQAQYLQAQQQLMELQQRMLQTQQPPSSQPVNPHDPQQNWVEWMRWELAQTSNITAQRAKQEIMQELMSAAQQNQELQWVQTHPGVDVQALKIFNRMNGIQESALETGWRLMNMPQALNQAQTNAINSTMKAFSQPQTSPSTVRGGVGGGATAPNQLSYEKLALDFQRTNGAVYDSWPEALRKEFDRETWRRDMASRSKG